MAIKVKGDISRKRGDLLVNGEAAFLDFTAPSVGIRSET